MHFPFAWLHHVQVFVLAYVAIAVPIRVCFGIPAKGAAYIVDLMVDAYFWADIVLNFRTGFIKKGELVMDPTKIRKRYAMTRPSLFPQ